MTEVNLSIQSTSAPQGPVQPTGKVVPLFPPQEVVAAEELDRVLGDSGVAQEQALDGGELTLPPEIQAAIDQANLQQLRTYAKNLLYRFLSPDMSGSENREQLREAALKYKGENPLLLSFREEPQVPQELLKASVDAMS